VIGLFSELFYRAAFVVFYIGMSASRLGPSSDSPTLKRSRGERWETLKKEGVFGVASLVLSVYGNLIVGMLYIFDVKWIGWSYLQLGPWVRVVGLVLGVVSVLFLYWSARELGEAYSYTVEVQEDQGLVTSGPYALVRHPIYTGTVLFLFAQGLVSDNWLFFVILVLLVPYLLVRIGREEEMLVGEFGDRYREYMRRSKKLVPYVY